MSDIDDTLTNARDDALMASQHSYHDEASQLNNDNGDLSHNNSRGSGGSGNNSDDDGRGAQSTGGCRGGSGAAGASATRIITISQEFRPAPSGGKTIDEELIGQQTSHLPLSWSETQKRLS